jgi:hypothetical protein
MTPATCRLSRSLSNRNARFMTPGIEIETNPMLAIFSEQVMS